MASITELDVLLKSMEPVLVAGEFVFYTLPEEKLLRMKLKPRMTFHEKEGATIIIAKEEADANSLPYEAVWSQITLNVHSSLQAVGFLAAISKKLADAGISINAVSAYYHDHLFVQKEKAKQAVKLLKELSQAE